MVRTFTDINVYVFIKINKNCEKLNCFQVFFNLYCKNRSMIRYRTS